MSLLGALGACHGGQVGEEGKWAGELEEAWKPPPPICLKVWAHFTEPVLAKQLKLSAGTEALWGACRVLMGRRREEGSERKREEDPIWK